MAPRKDIAHHCFCVGVLARGVRRRIGEQWSGHWRESWNEGRPADCGEMTACSSSDWCPALFNGQRPGICPLAPPIRVDRGKSPGWWWCGSGVPSFTVCTSYRSVRGSSSTPFGIWARLGELAAWWSTKTDVTPPNGRKRSIPASSVANSDGGCMRRSQRMVTYQYPFR